MVGKSMPFSCDYLRALRVRLDAHVGRATCSEIVNEEGTGSNG